MKKIICLVIFVMISMFVTSCCIPENPLEKLQGQQMYAEILIADSLMRTLNSGAAIYVAQQRVAPESFSDYVLEKGEVEGQYVISLEKVSEDLTDIEGLDTTDMVLTFDSGLIAKYHLNRYKVTYELNKDKKAFEKFMDPELVAKHKINFAISDSASMLTDYIYIEEMPVQEACDRVIKELNQDGEMSYYTPSLPLFGTEPAEGVVTINPVGEKSVEIVAYGKNKEILYSKKI